MIGDGMRREAATNTLGNEVIHQQSGTNLRLQATEDGSCHARRVCRLLCRRVRERGRGLRGVVGRREKAHSISWDRIGLLLCLQVLNGCKGMKDRMELELETKC